MLFGPRHPPSYPQVPNSLPSLPSLCTYIPLQPISLPHELKNPCLSTWCLTIYLVFVERITPPMRRQGPLTSGVAPLGRYITAISYEKLAQFIYTPEIEV